MGDIEEFSTEIYINFLIMYRRRRYLILFVVCSHMRMILRSNSKLCPASLAVEFSLQ